MASFHEKEEDAVPKHWVSIYPAYINSKKTVKEGRRIPKSKAVETPTSQEICDVLKAAGLNIKLQRTKMYPRDQNRDYTFQGRIRVELKNGDGKILNENFPTRDSLMLYAVEMIPKLKSRLQKGATAAAAQAEPAPSQKAQKKKKAR